MNRIFLFTATLLLSALPAAAQQSDSPRTASRSDRPALKVETIDRDSAGIDMLRRIDTTDGNLIRLREGGGEGDMVLEVGGFGLKLGRTYMSKQLKNPPRFYFTIMSDIELGFTHLTGIDYGGYGVGERGFLDQRLGASFHFSFAPFNLGWDMNRKRSLSLRVGLDYTLENIRLTDNGITVGNDSDGRLIPVALEAPAAKSKIVYSYLGIPVRLHWVPVDRLGVSFVLHNDFLLGADAICKSPKQKHGLSGWRSYRLGLGASVAYYGLGLFVRYTPTPLFERGAGPECRTFSFGFDYSLSF